jgi:hypothetical protein
VLECSDQGVHGEQPAVLIDHICSVCCNVIMRRGICAVYRKQVSFRLLFIQLVLHGSPTAAILMCTSVAFQCVD